MDGMDAAEEHVALLPAIDGREGRGQHLDRAIVVSRLDAGLVVLDVKPWGVDRFLQRHGEDEAVEQHLEDGGTDAVGAPRAQRRQATAFVHDQRRGHHRAYPHVPRPLMKTVGIDVFLAENVVEHDPGAGNDVTRALAVGQRQAGGVSRFVDDADVGGSARRHRTAEDLRPIGGDQGWVQQIVGGGVRVQLVKPAFHPSPIGEFHHLGQPAQVRRGSKPQRRGVGVAKQLQGEGDEDAAGGRRRIEMEAGGEDIEGQRCATLDPIPLQVVEGEVAAEAPAIVDDPVGDLAPVEQVGALDRQHLEGVGELLLHQDLALADELARPLAAFEDRLAGDAALQNGADHPEHVGLHLVHANAGAGEFDGWLDDPPHRHDAEIAVRLEKPPDETRRGDRSHADVELLLSGAEVGEDREKIDIGGGRPKPRCLGTKS